VPRALLSVSDKTGLVAFGRGLVDLGWELVATGGTQAALTGAGLPVVPVEALTGLPEMMDGRVKTLHPAVHAGLLARRDRQDDIEALHRHGFHPIDLVAVNLYPFRATVAGGATLPEAIEQIDIGGPSMVRAAAKNHPHVVVVVDPDDYGPVLEGLRAGDLGANRRLALAARAFAHTAAYDAAVAAYLTAAAEPGAFPVEASLAFERPTVLRYGENPHQRAAFYRDPWVEPESIATAEQLGGKELSYNNIMDADSAWRLVRSLEGPAAVAVKHATPCGVATAPTIAQAFERARAADPEAIFGGIVALSHEVDEATAKGLADLFLEVVVAPGFDPAAREILARKKNLRLLRVPAGGAATPPWPLYQMLKVGGGVLLQERDDLDLDPAALRTVTRREPTADEMAALRLAWTVCKFVRSNAIVLVKDGMTVGIGGGQVSRIAAVRQAVAQAGGRAWGSVMASDAYFPMPDNIEVAADAGVTAVIQPGGSIRDGDAIAAADSAGMAMVTTGVRHFRHS